MTDAMTEERVEQQEKWEPIAGIESPAGGAFVAEDHEGLTVTLLFSEIADGPDSDLRIKFGHVVAYSVYEEFAHPWESVNLAPRLAGRWEGYIYPLLEIKNSKWMASLPHLSLVDPNCVHYRLLTVDEIVDVLSSKTPEATWVKGVGS
jgi:hypothetical protein